MERWASKVALVTGASSGIGRSVTRSLIQHGMKVLGVSIEPLRLQALASELSGKLFPMKCDVKNEAEVKDVFAYARKELGGIDVCINSAGVAHDAPLLSPDSATAEWKDMLEVNVLAVSVINREYMRQMKERGVDDGHIILLNSMAGHRVINSSKGHFYSASKYGIQALVQGTRHELKNMKSNIRISCISPGLVRTEFLEKWDRIDHDTATKRYDNAHYNGLVSEPEDISSAIVFALSMPQRSEMAANIWDIIMDQTLGEFTKKSQTTLLNWQMPQLLK